MPVSGENGRFPRYSPHAASLSQSDASHFSLQTTHVSIDIHHGILTQETVEARPRAAGLRYVLSTPTLSTLTNKTVQAPTKQSTSPTPAPKSSKPPKQVHPSSSSPNASTPPTARHTSRNTPKPCSPPRPQRNNPPPSTRSRPSPQKLKRILWAGVSPNSTRPRRNITIPRLCSRRAGR